MPAAALALAAGMVLAGCGGPSETKIVMVNGDTPIVVHNIDGRYATGFTGYLRYVDPGCFIFEPETPDGNTSGLLAWPGGTVPVTQGREVVGVEVPGHGAIPLDSWVLFGGVPATDDVTVAGLQPECDSSANLVFTVTDIGCVGESPADCEE